MLAESYKCGQPVVVFGLLPHEQKMSVVHFLVKRFYGDDDDEPIKSKEPLTFHVGYRRFTACPIYSQHTNMNKHKVRCCDCCIFSLNVVVIISRVHVISHRPLNSQLSFILFHDCFHRHFFPASHLRNLRQNEVFADHCQKAWSLGTHSLYVTKALVGAEKVNSGWSEGVGWFYVREVGSPTH